MKSGWQTSTLGDVLAVIRNGANCKQDKSGNGDRISRIESISDSTFDLGKVGYAKLSERDKEKNQLLPGDILFSHINSPVHVGKTAVFDCDEPVYHGVNLLLMRPKEVVTSAYLNHALRFLFQNGYWRGVCKQSVNQASVNQQDISRVEIHYPKSLPEQRRIVGILDEAFAGLATAKANAEKNLHNARALFESHLQSVFSQRGKGWVETTVGDHVDFLAGFAFKSSQYTNSEDGVRLVRGDNIVQGEFRWEGVKRWPKKSAADYSQFAFEENDVVLAMDRPWVAAGLKVAFVTKSDLPSLQVQRTARLRAKSSLHWKYLFHLIRSSSYVTYLLDGQTGLGVPHISGKQILSFQFPLPPIAEQKRIVANLDSLHQETTRLASIYQQKLAALEALKKSLLHQAFSGEL